MYRIERQHEGPTRGHWLPVKTERFRIALAAVAACMVMQ